MSSDPGLHHDLPQAFRIVWLVLGAVSGLVVVTPFLLPSASLMEVFPMCAAKAAGGACSFCGMTTAFVSIGQGDWGGAYRSNAGAIPLFAALLLNFGWACTYTMMRVIRHAHT